MNLRAPDVALSFKKACSADRANLAFQQACSLEANAAADTARIRGAILSAGLPLRLAAQTSEPSKRHDNFVTLLPMTFEQTPIEIGYSFHLSPFGTLLVASSQIGLCHAAFVKSHSAAKLELIRAFPGAHLQQVDDPRHSCISSLFHGGATARTEKITLHLSGTTFQHRVWRALLMIPIGTLVTYGQIAEAIGSPSAARAVGTAIGANKAAFLIPCHRVVRRSGEIGGFMWGTERKTALIAWEIGGLCK